MTLSRWLTSRNSLFRSSKTCGTNYPFGMFAVPRDQVSRVHGYSGTTGQPTVVGYTGGFGAHYGAERLGCTVAPLSGDMTNR